MAADPLNQVSLGTEHFEHRGITNGCRYWYTREGDGVGLYYCGLPPDLPSKQKTTDAFISHYLARLSENGIEASIESVAEMPAVMALVKVAQEPAGFAYLGSYTFPFRDSSYVIKIQCEERGTTGIREAILFDRHLSNGGTSLGNSGNISDDFSPDDAIYDDEFPDHPLSRCRRGLRYIKSSITFDDAVRQLPSFDLPGE